MKDLKAILVLGSLWSAMLAGCLDAERTSRLGDQPDDEVLPDPRIELRTVVHRAGGVLVSDEEYPGDLPVIEQRSVGPPIGSAFEPTIGIVPSGAAFYVAADPVGYRPDVWRSRDGGEKWELATTMATSGDPYVYADPDTGRVYSVDLSPTLDCSVFQWSDNEGLTWTRSVLGLCGTIRTQLVAPIPGVHFHDHQTIVTGRPHATPTNGYPNILYYCSNHVDGGGAVCFTSTDGGISFGSPVRTGLNHCYGQTGHVVTGPNGDAFLPQVSCERAKEEDFGKTWVAISRDDGRTWTKHIVTNGTVPVQHKFGAADTPHEASVAVDANGTVYYMFLDAQTIPWLVVSRDGGETWQEPMSIGRPGLTGATKPSLVAGDRGRIAFLYVGTTSPGGHNATASTTWNAYLGYSLDADAAQPTFATTTVNALSDPIKRDSCLDRCHGPVFLVSGGLGDFLDISMDPRTGRVWAAVVDICTGPCSGATGKADGNELGRAAVGVQLAGTTLRGPPRE